MFTKDFLLGLRRKAIRRRVWFGLDSLDRGIFNLVTLVVDRVESSVLGVVLVKIVSKLRDALKSGFVERMETYGVERVKILVTQAVEWGYAMAVDWSSDMGFVRYLTVLDFNWPTGFGV